MTLKTIFVASFTFGQSINEFIVKLVRISETNQADRQICTVLLRRNYICFQNIIGRQTDRQTDGRTDGWMDGWMDG